jgi:ribosomal protein S18 acetylase RimI-like enzyme
MTKNMVKLPNLPELYQLKDNDFDRGTNVLAQAFADDPIWSRILADQPFKFQAVYRVPLKYTLYYGKVYAPSANLEGTALWLGYPYTSINILRMFCSRSIFLGLQIGGKLIREINHVFQNIERDRRTWMEVPYVYLFALGIYPQYQGQGYGTKLVKTMLDALPLKIPVYLETESERNVKFYEKLGFEVIKQINVPVYDLPMWELLYKK